MRKNGRTSASIVPLACALAASCLWAAVTGAVDGVVKDKATGEPVAGVKITLVSAKSETLSYELTSDQKGHFYKSGLVPGIYKMTLEKEGYIPQGGSIRVILDETVRLDLRIEAGKAEEAGAPAAAKKVAAANERTAAGKYDEAIVLLNEAINELPQNAVPYFYRGLAYEKSGRSEEALQDYQKASEFKPDFILPYSRSGIIWARKGDFEKAGEFYKKAIASGDQDPTTLYNHGVCLTNLGRGQEAIPVFEKLLAQDPEYSDAYYQLGLLCLGSGETARAKDLLEKFLDKDPENKNAALAKEILKTLGQ